MGIAKVKPKNAIRLITNDKSTKVISYLSVPQGEEMLGVESQLERDCVLMWSMDSEVVEIRTQPVKLEYVLNKKRTYTIPDILVRFRDEKKRVLLVEVKPKSKAIKSAFIEKALCRKKAANDSGYDYRVMTEEDIRTEPKCTNVMRLFASRKYSVDLKREKEIRKFVRKERTVTIGSIIEKFIDIKMEQVMSLIAGFRLKTDLDVLITDQSVVTIK